MSKVAASLYGLILGCVSEEFPNINDRNSLARSRRPITGSPEISEASGR